MTAFEWTVAAMTLVGCAVLIVQWWTETRYWK